MRPKISCSSAAAVAAGRVIIWAKKPAAQGGGIVIINAANIVSATGQIIASGANGPECTGPGGTCDDDGTGGGGGGGLIAVKRSRKRNADTPLPTAAKAAMLTLNSPQQSHRLAPAVAVAAATSGLAALRSQLA